MQGSRWTPYLPGNQILELLDLFMGLRVLLQVPVCKEGLAETGRVTQCTCSANTGFCTLTMLHALRIELCIKQIHTELTADLGSHPPQHPGQNVPQGQTPKVELMGCLQQQSRFLGSKAIADLVAWSCWMAVNTALSATHMPMPPTQPLHLPRPDLHLNATNFFVRGRVTASSQPSLRQCPSCLFSLCLDQGQQAFFVKGHMVNILGFVDHTGLYHNYSMLPLLNSPVTVSGK